MLAYYGSRISEHMTKTPEGFLVCLSVPIARLGVQKYLPDEIGLTGDSIVNVHRTQDEVFASAAIASFEGKPVTLDHPPVTVTPENSGMYVKGHAEHVRQGTGPDADLLIADLFITDADLIREIENGLREVSCGYECEYVEDGKGRIIQSRIRGNHVAVVQNGRAGNRVSIKDSAPEPIKRKGKKPMKSSMFSRLVAHWAQDAEPEEVAEVIDEMMNPEEPEAPNFDEDPMTDPAVDPAVPPVTDNANEIAALKASIDKIMAHLGIADAPAVDEDPMAALENEMATDAAEGDAPLMPGDVDEVITDETEEAVTVPAEEMTDALSGDITNGVETAAQIIGSNDSALAILRAVKPYVAMLPEDKRKRATDSMTAAYRKAVGKSSKPTSDGYGAILRNQRNNAKNRVAQTKKVDDADLGRHIMAKHNPHYKNK